MSIAAGGILCTFDAILRAQGDVTSTVQKTDQALDDLRQYLAPMVASWDGQAKETYHALQVRWDRSAAELRDILQQIANHLGTSYEQYKFTEGKNYGVWSA